MWFRGGEMNNGATKGCKVVNLGQNWQGNGVMSKH